MKKRQGMKIGCIEEIAYRMGFINKERLLELAEELIKSGYGQYIQSIANKI